MTTYTEHTTTQPGSIIRLSARSSSVGWVFANSFSVKEGPRPELPSHEVRYSMEDVDDNGNIEAKALHAVPIGWTPKRLFEQNWFYKKIGCLDGRYMVADGLYRRYSKDKLGRQEVMEYCARSLESLDSNDPHDYKFRQLVRDLSRGDEIIQSS